MRDTCFSRRIKIEFRYKAWTCFRDVRVFLELVSDSSSHLNLIEKSREICVWKGETIQCHKCFIKVLKHSLA